MRNRRKVGTLTFLGCASRNDVVDSEIKLGSQIFICFDIGFAGFSQENSTSQGIIAKRPIVGRKFDGKLPSLIKRRLQPGLFDGEMIPRTGADVFRHETCLLLEGGRQSKAVGANTPKGKISFGGILTGDTELDGLAGAGRFPVGHGGVCIGGAATAG